MARKPYDEMTKIERDVYWDEIAQHSGRPFTPEEKAKLHEGGVSIFGIYPPDVDYLIEETAEGERYLWRDGARLRRLAPGEGETPLPPPTKPLTLEAARRIEALEQGRANNRLSGLEVPEYEFRRLCQLAREAESDEEFEQRALAEFFYGEDEG